MYDAGDCAWWLCKAGVPNPSTSWKKKINDSLKKIDPKFVQEIAASVFKRLITIRRYGYDAL